MFFLLIKTLPTAKLLESDINWQYSGRGRRAERDTASTSLATGKREREKNPKWSLISAHMPRETHREHIFTAPRYHFYAVIFLTITAFHDGAAKHGAKEPLTQVPAVPDFQRTHYRGNR